MAEPEVGLLHPGEMGASVGAALVAGGARVHWCARGRSDASARRAASAGLVDAGTLDALVRRVEIIFSVCPPASATEVAEAVFADGFRGLFVDANAIAPATAESIAARAAAAGATFVDGGIVGPPAVAPGSTRLYLSGEAADSIAARFSGTALEARVVPGPPGAASALKMAYAGWTKGLSALLLAVRGFARESGVEASLLGEWQVSQPHLAAQSEHTARGVAPKAWRFAGEMEEIAAAFASAGLPEGFHRAAADVYARLADLGREGGDAGIDEVAGRLARRGVDAQSDAARRTSSMKKPTESR